MADAQIDEERNVVQVVEARLHGVLGKYRLIAQLGKGGMAEVFLALARGPSGFSKLVVLKVLRPLERTESDTNFVTMFLDEARLSARLNHLNVVQTYEVGEADGRHMIVMEYLEGQSFAAVLARSRNRKLPVPLAVHLRVVVDTLAGLHYAHELTDFDGTPLGLVHRDVSPHNVFVLFDGHVKVLDFGIAKATTSSTETRTGVMKGKVGYMAPEQVLADRPDRRADIYSVGVMLWEALAGRRMWHELADMTVLYNVVNGQAPDVGTVRPDLPQELRRICNKAVAQKRSDRYDTALDFQLDLERYLRDMGDQTTARDIARLVSDMFADVRTETRRVIEEHVNQAQTLPTGEYEALNPAMLPGGRASMPTPSRSAAKLPMAARDSNPVVLIDDESAAPSASSTRLTGPRQRSAYLPIFVMAGVLLAAAFAALMLVFLKGKQATAVGPVSSSLPALSSLPAIAAEPPKPGEAVVPVAADIQLRVEASPPQAKLFLDQRPLPTNPSAARVPKDGAQHALRADAKGYQTKTVDVVFDADVNVTLTLERAAVVGGAGGRPAAPQQPASNPTSAVTTATPATVAPPAEPVPPPGPATTTTSGKPLRKLDPNNPWN